jgi:electron transfer flavoprotein alpha subunit
MADTILVVAELQDGTPKKITYEMLTAARSVASEMDYEVAVVAFGEGLDEEALAQDLGGRGAERILVLDSAEFAAYNVEPWAAALRQVVEEEGPEVVLLGMTPVGRDLAPRLAAKLNAGLASDITGLRVEDGELLITRPMYSGQVIATLKVKSTPVLATVRPNTWAPAQAEGGAGAEVESFEADDVPEARTEVLAVEAQGGDRPDLSDAATVISAGRGIKGPENFHLVEELADVLGAAVGTTRAVVDAGWRPYEEQVGQTGKTVSPNLYIAVGVSGALQHLSGMRTSKTIVAINKDPDAPIFRLADYGIVGDLFEVVPAMTEALKEME